MHAVFAVAKVVRDVERCLGALGEELKTFGPALDDLVERKFGRRSALVAAVELGAVDESSGVVDAHSVGGLRSRTGPEGGDFDHESGLGGEDAVLALLSHTVKKCGVALAEVDFVLLAEVFEEYAQEAVALHVRDERLAVVEFVEQRLSDGGGVHDGVLVHLFEVVLDDGTIA